MARSRAGRVPRGPSGSRRQGAGCPAPSAAGHRSAAATGGAVGGDRAGDFRREGGKPRGGRVRSVRGERPPSGADRRGPATGITQRIDSHTFRLLRSTCACAQSTCTKEVVHVVWRSRAGRAAERKLSGGGRHAAQRDRKRRTRPLGPLPASKLPHSIHVTPAGWRPPKERTGAEPVRGHGAAGPDSSCPSEGRVPDCRAPGA